MSSRFSTLIRPGRVDDAAGIARVHVQTWRKMYQGVVPQAYLDTLDVGQWTENWAAILRTAASRILIAEVDGTQAGFTSVGGARGWSGPETSEISAIYVEPAWHDTGVGSRLFDAAVRELAGEGHRGMMLWVLARNPRARAFYARKGGIVAAYKMEELGGAVVEEVAYAWRELPPAKR